MRVVLFKGASAYGATRTFIDEAAAAFERKGYAPTIIDVLPGMDLAAALRAEAQAGPIALAYSIAILGEFRDPDGRSIGEMLDAPHVLHHVDYPLTHIERLAATSPDTAVLVIDETHVEAVFISGRRGSIPWATRAWSNASSAGTNSCEVAICSAASKMARVCAGALAQAGVSAL